MKFNFTLGTFAIVIVMSACAVNQAEDAGPGRDAGTGATGSQGDDEGNAPGATSDNDDNAAGATSDDDGNAPGSMSDGNAAGSKNDGRGDVGGSKGNGAGGTGSAGNGHGNAAGSNSNTAAGSRSGGDGNAAGAKGDGDSNAAGAKGDTDGTSNGDGGAGEVPSSGGSAGLAGNGGSAGLASNGGSAGLASNGGSAGLASNGGSTGIAGTGGTGGSTTDGTGGTGGSTTDGTGGTGGSTTDGSGGTGGSTSGGSAGSGGATTGGGGDSSLDPEYLFTTETFGGNGRTCVTCHTAQTGTINPDQAQALYAANPNDPLFQPIDSEDGVGTDYTQLRARATFRVAINLPSGVSLTTNPSATSAVFRRGAPTTINTPALDPVLMWDGRQPSLTDQALSAILGHAQATVTPTSTQLDLIAGFEQGPDFFSSDLLRQYDQGGPAPTWPAGGTDAEQRGRRWFAQDSAAPRFNVCGQCHGGPMANTTASNSGLPVGQRFQTVNVSEFNHLNNPTYQFTFPDPKNPGKTVTVTTPDPGRALVTGDVRDLNFFKIPTLWGVKNTAPYFHDNSAATLEELMDHYADHLATFLPSNRAYPSPHVPTAQDKTDIIAYLKLL